MEHQADVCQPTLLPPPEPSVAVKVRERASRRAVKQAVDEAEAEARAQQVAAQLVGWYNQQVGVSLFSTLAWVEADGYTFSIRRVSR